MSRRGNARGRRKIDGILLLDKPKGISSNRALQRARGIFNARKAGHTGSLDPLATGMLPICFGEATKFSAFLLDSEKTYQVHCLLGVATDTGDAEGKVVKEAAVPKLGDKAVRKVLHGFLGASEQVPPMYSAVKHEGQRLYKLARQGKEVRREPRGIEIHDIRLEEIDTPRLSFTVKCSKGTYVRVLVEDIAAKLGTLAHVTDLRRTVSGPFGPGGMRGLEELEATKVGGFATLDGCLLPVDAALEHLPLVTLNDDMAFYIGKGQSVLVPKAPIEGLVRIYDKRDHFLGLGYIADDGLVAPKRLVANSRDD